MTVAELARQSDLSPGAISKIERGLTPPSLASLSAIAGALAVPVTALFRKHEEQRDASYVEAGKGLVIERRGTRVGPPLRAARAHDAAVASRSSRTSSRSTEESEVFPLFQHAGVEFIYLLEGEVVYRAAGSTYHLRPGDSLLFDGDVAHGPEKLVRLPIRMLAVISRATPTSADGGTVQARPASGHARRGNGVRPAMYDGPDPVRCRRFLTGNGDSCGLPGLRRIG